MKQNKNTKNPCLIFNERYNKIFAAMLEAEKGLRELIGDWFDCLPHKNLAVYCDSKTDTKIYCHDWKNNEVECELSFDDECKGSLTLRITRQSTDMVIIIKPITKDYELPEYDNVNVYNKFDLQEKKGEQAIIEFDRSWQVNGNFCCEMMSRYNYDLIMCEGKQMLGMRHYDHEGAYSPEIYPVEENIFLLDGGTTAGV